MFIDSYVGKLLTFARYVIEQYQNGQVADLDLVLRDIVVIAPHHCTTSILCIANGIGKASL